MTCLTMFIYGQNKDIIEKLDAKDSIAYLSSQKVLKSKAHKLLFKIIYKSKIRNEETEFYKEIQHLMPFDNKKIDTILFYQMNAFGESVYDTSIRSNKFEIFLSEKIHVNTKIKVIKNRYLFFQKGDFFSPYRAFENARLIRSSGIFHDVKIQPVQVPNDTNHIILVYYIQDVFPYGFSLGVNSMRDFSFGIENVNIMGLNHKLNTEFRINSNDTRQVFGYGARYTIPNVFKRSFVDAYAQFKNLSTIKNYEIGIYRLFARPEFRWAGGNITSYNERILNNINGTNIYNNVLDNQLWISRAFPFNQYNTTVNSIITGIKYNFVHNYERPPISPNSNYRFWNTNLLLYSLGYSRIKYVQDRLINGFGRTEDIPIGISINGLYGMDFNEFNIRNYYGGQILGQYYTKSGYYINLSTRIGFYSQDKNKDQGVFDFHLQNVSKAYKLGNFRLRNYFNLRTTIGINQDSTEFITLTDYDGIRGANNGSFRGNSRFTSSFQSNLLLPFSFLGFRFSVLGVFEIAKIQSSLGNFFGTPLKSGFSMGLALKNENLIFDVIQIQYGYYPSTSNITQRGLVISSIIPFRFQSLDISKPNTVAYE